MRPLFGKRLHVTKGILTQTTQLVRETLLPGRRIHLVVDERVITRAGFKHQYPETFSGQRPSRTTAASTGSDEHRIVTLISQVFASAWVSRSPDIRSAGAGNRGPARASWRDANNRNQTDPTRPS